MRCPALPHLRVFSWSTAAPKRSACPCPHRALAGVAEQSKYQGLLRELLEAQHGSSFPFLTARAVEESTRGPRRMDASAALLSRDRISESTSVLRGISDLSRP